MASEAERPGPRVVSGRQNHPVALRTGLWLCCLLGRGATQSPRRPRNRSRLQAGPACSGGAAVGHQPEAISVADRSTAR